MNDRTAFVDLQIGDLASIKTFVGQLQAADLQPGLGFIRRQDEPSSSDALENKPAKIIKKKKKSRNKKPTSIIIR